MFQGSRFEPVRARIREVQETRSENPHLDDPALTETRRLRVSRPDENINVRPRFRRLSWARSLSARGRHPSRSQEGLAATARPVVVGAASLLRSLAATNALPDYECLFEPALMFDTHAARRDLGRLTADGDVEDSDDESTRPPSESTFFDPESDAEEDEAEHAKSSRCCDQDASAVDETSP